MQTMQTTPLKELPDINNQLGLPQHCISFRFKFVKIIVKMTSNNFL